MAADIIQAQYEQLEDIAKRFCAQAEKSEALSGRLQTSYCNLLQGGWEGAAAKSFFQEMENDIFPALQRLTDAFAGSERVTRAAVATYRQAEEEAAAVFKQQKEESVSWIDKLAEAAGDVLVTLGKNTNPLQLAVGILGFAGLTFAAGGTYAGQVIVGGSRLFKELAGLSPHLTHIKGGNVAAHMVKDAAKGVDSIDIAAAVIQVAGQWVEDFREYGDNPAELVSALAVDTLLVGGISLGASYVGGVAGTAAGAYIGGAIGGVLGSVIPVLGTGVGAAVGATLGGIAGKFVAGWAADKYITDPLMKSEWRKDIIHQGGQVVENAIDQGGKWVKGASRAIEDTFDSAAQRILNIKLPKLALP